MNPLPETDSSTSESLNDSAFTSEMDAVRALIAEAISDLGVPLSQLVQSRFQDDDRLHRAALVLSAGYDERDGASYARIQLAAALEMLLADAKPSLTAVR